MRDVEDIREEVRLEDAVKDAWRAWMSGRVEEIHRRVSAHDILRRNGVKMRYDSDAEEQVSCPFHGEDKHPSARVYPSDTRGPSHVWCFACNERWDVIGLWKKFSGLEDQKFGAVLRGIENDFGITPPPVPTEVAEYQNKEGNPKLKHLLDMFQSCDNRLRSRRAAFEMTSFLKLGVVSDRLRFQVESESIDYDKAETILQQILDKITEKERAYVGEIGDVTECPDD